MDRTEAVLQKLFAALPYPAYDLGILSDRGMYRLEAVSAARILRILPYLKRRNAHGAHIYGRPTGESAYTLLDDLTSATLTRMTDEGFAPAAVIETSPGNFQAWLRHTEPITKELGTLAAKTLAARFEGDPGAAYWRRFGRLPGFTNREFKYRDGRGLLPFVLLHGHTGTVFPAAEAFSAELIATHARATADASRTALRFAGLPLRDRTDLHLSQFRNAQRYQGRPATADLAFSICARSHGWAEEFIADALRTEYLSRDTDPGRQKAYLRRTLAKVSRWLAR